MDLTAITSFIRVAETGSFSVASEQLFITQPAVSKRVSNLEAELGTALFDRISRQITLTEAGRLFLPRAKALLQDAVDLKRAVTNLSGEVTGRLLLGTSHHIGLHRLPPILKQYANEYPDVQLDIRFQDSEEACRAVETGELEMAIVTLPIEPMKRLEAIQVWHDPLAIVVGERHPLSNRRGLTIEDLAEHQAVLPSASTYTRLILEQALSEKDLSLQVTMSTNYLEILKMLVTIGQGWSLLPHSMLDASLKQLKIKAFALSRELGLVFHQSRTLSNAAQAMIDTCLLRSSNSPLK